MTSTPPILLLIFNRPDLTRQVMEQVRQAEPSQLFVAADGPRPDHPKDPEMCKRAREVATQVDWDCEDYTLFRSENLGLKHAVSEAITWFFEHVEAGIILEDDCIPHQAFFKYCHSLLRKYRYDKRIMMISGVNFQPDNRNYSASYYFSIHTHCWAWATWDRAWDKYDGDVSEWASLSNTQWLEGWLGGEEEAAYWANIFSQVRRGEIDSWAYPWTFACWKEHGLTILPKVNLVSNKSFREYLTHTNNASSPFSDVETDSLSLPLEHPDNIVSRYDCESYTSHIRRGVVDRHGWLKKVWSIRKSNITRISA